MSATNDELLEVLRRPIPLDPNRVYRFYKGGALIDQFRGAPEARDTDYPEDWVGSITPANNPGEGHPPDEGLSKIALPSGEQVALKALLETFQYQNFDLGAAVHGRFGGFGYTAGVFNGNGTDRPALTNGRSYAGRLTYALPTELPVALGAAISHREFRVSSAPALETRDGTRIHVRNRGFVTASNRGYAIRWEVAASEWEQNLDEFELIAKGFKPDRVD